MFDTPGLSLNQPHINAIQIHIVIILQKKKNNHLDFSLTLFML